MLYRHHRPAAQKVIPLEGNGVTARPATSAIQRSVLEWTKVERLHKYWPVFSHFSYHNLVSLSEENIDDRLRQIGSLPITTGARNRILRCTKYLRERVDIIENISLKTKNLPDVADILTSVLKTPISYEHAEPDGRQLTTVLHKKLVEASEWFLDSALLNYKFRILLRTYSEHEGISEDDRRYAATFLSRAREVRARHDSCPLPRRSNSSSSGSSISHSPARSSKSTPGDSDIEAVIPHPMTKALIDSMDDKPSYSAVTLKPPSKISTAVAGPSRIPQKLEKRKIILRVPAEKKRGAWMGTHKSSFGPGIAAAVDRLTSSIYCSAPDASHLPSPPCYTSPTSEQFVRQHSHENTPRQLEKMKDELPDLLKDWRLQYDE